MTCHLLIYTEDQRGVQLEGKCPATEKGPAPCETTSSEIWRRGSQSLYQSDRKGKARSKGLLKRVYWNNDL